MSDTDAQQSDPATPAQESEPAQEAQPAPALPEVENPEQYISWSGKSVDPDNIETK